VIAKNALSLGAGFLRSMALFLRTRRLLPASHPLLVSLGRTLASLGFLPTPYRASN
jgi:hypothetical protein